MRYSGLSHLSNSSETKTPFTYICFIHLFGPIIMLILMFGVFKVQFEMKKKTEYIIL